MKNKKINIILIIINFGLYFYFKNKIGVDFTRIDILYITIPTILLGLFLTKVNYIIWSATFMASLAFMLYGHSLTLKSTCSYLMCGIDIGPVIAAFFIGIMTLILVLTQIIKYFIKRNKEEKKINNIA